MRDLKIFKTKIESFNWEAVQEPLRLVFIFVLLWLALYQLAQAQVLDQDLHRRTLVFEAWTGSYINGELDLSAGKVELTYCKKAGCRTLGEVVSIEEISQYDGELVENLKALKLEYADKVDRSLWRFISGGSESNADIVALNEVIKEVENVGIANWILLTQQNMQTFGPEISSPQLAERLADTISKSLEVKEQRP